MYVRVYEHTCAHKFPYSDKVKPHRSPPPPPILCGQMGQLTFGHLSIISFNNQGAGKWSQGVSNSLYHHGNNCTEVHSLLG